MSWFEAEGSCPGDMPLRDARAARTNPNPFPRRLRGRGTGGEAGRPGRRDFSGWTGARKPFRYPTLWAGFVPSSPKLRTEEDRPHPDPLRTANAGCLTGGKLSGSLRWRRARIVASVCAQFSLNQRPWALWLVRGVPVCCPSMLDKALGLCTVPRYQLDGARSLAKAQRRRREARLGVLKERKAGSRQSLTANPDGNKETGYRF